jgi:hypothetical protein
LVAVVAEVVVVVAAAAVDAGDKRLMKGKGDEIHRLYAQILGASGDREHRRPFMCPVTRRHTAGGGANNKRNRLRHCASGS